MRRATQQKCGDGKAYVDFYPRSPCGERREYWVGGYGTANISIHALLAESDERNHLFSRWICYFYPRSPCGERLTDVSYLSIDNSISIHALLAESDCAYLPMASSWYTFLSTLSLRRATRGLTLLYSIVGYFYPRSPCGERPVTRSANL